MSSKHGPSACVSGHGVELAERERRRGGPNRRLGSNGSKPRRQDCLTCPRWMGRGELEPPNPVSGIKSPVATGVASGPWRNRTSNLGIKSPRGTAATKRNELKRAATSPVRRCNEPQQAATGGDKPVLQSVLRRVVMVDNGCPSRVERSAGRRSGAKRRPFDFRKRVA